MRTCRYDRVFCGIMPRILTLNSRRTYSSQTMAQYIFTMNRVGKIVPPKRVILRDISLSFFPGAKIGVLGLNGSGKSSLLRIMAGIDTEIEGEARPQPGIKVGFLPQEPRLDETKDVRGNVEEALGHIKEALERLDAVYAAYAEADADFDALAKEQAELEDLIQATDGHNLERTLEVAADALRLPPWDADVTKLSGGERRRVALCRLLLSKPDMLLLDEPTNHLDAESVAWLERFLHEYPGTVVAVTHDRYFLDNVAGWILELDRGHGIPWEGNYSSWLEQKEQRLELEQKQEAARIRTMKHELEWVRSNPKGRHAKSKARLARFEELQSQDFQSRNETNEIYIPPGPRLGDLVIEARGLRKAYGDNLLYEDLSFNLPKGGIVGDHRSQRRRQDHPVPHPHRAGAAGRRGASRRGHGGHRLCGSEPRRPGRLQDRLGGRSRKARTTSSSVATRCPPVPIAAASTSRARISRNASATSPAASATGSTWPSS